MKIRLSEAELNHLNAFLDSCPDAERLSAREVVLDLYDIERPISLNFVFVMGERIEDPEAVRAALREAGALPGA